MKTTTGRLSGCHSKFREGRRVGGLGGSLRWIKEPERLMGVCV